MEASSSCADQGVVNYFLARESQAGTDSAWRDRLHVRGRAEAMDGIELARHARWCLSATVIHWAGCSNALPWKILERRLNFYEAYYYSRLPLGRQKGAPLAATVHAVARGGAGVDFGEASPATRAGRTVPPATTCPTFRSGIWRPSSIVGHLGYPLLIVRASS